jgi:hypothetical protein
MAVQRENHQFQAKYVYSVCPGHVFPRPAMGCLETFAVQNLPGY